MRKLSIIFALLVIVGFASSCKQTYVCECSDVNGIDSFSVEIKDMRKNDAKIVCDDYSEFVGQCTIQ